MPRGSAVRRFPQRPTVLPTADAREILRRILDRMDGEEPQRILPFCRIKDVVPPLGPLSKSFCLRLLKEGKIRGRKLKGILLLEIQSLHELMEVAEEWTPTRGKK